MDGANHKNRAGVLYEGKKAMNSNLTIHFLLITFLSNI